MCLVTNQKRVKIAKEDIICYKLVIQESKKVVCSDNWDFSYKLKQLYKTDMTVDNYPQSYADEIVMEHYRFCGCFTKKARKMTNIHCGFHSAVSIKRFEDADYEFEGRVFVKCIIPKGSRYYEDATGLLVSNQIIIQKIIEKG